MGEVIVVPCPESQVALSESGEISVLAVMHDVRTLVTIKVCPFRCLSPRKVELGHPLASSVESNRFEDTIMLHHLGFLREIDNSLGRNVCPDFCNMTKQLLDEINIVKEGIATGVRIVVIWKHRPVTDKILAPRSEPSTAAGTLPEEESGIISGLDPSFTSGINREEPIEVIKPSSESFVRANHGIVRFEKRTEIDQSQSSITD